MRKIKLSQNPLSITRKSTIVALSIIAILLANFIPVTPISAMQSPVPTGTISNTPSKLSIDSTTAPPAMPAEQTLTPPLTTVVEVKEEPSEPSIPVEPDHLNLDCPEGSINAGAEADLPVVETSVPENAPPSGKYLCQGESATCAEYEATPTTLSSTGSGDTKMHIQQVPKYYVTTLSEALIIAPSVTVEYVKVEHHKELSEALIIAPSLSKGSKKPLSEQCELAHSFTKETYKALGEPLGVNGDFNKRVGKSFAEACTIDHSLAKAFDKPFAESCKATSIVSKTAEFIRGFSENVSALDNIQKGFYITAGESLSVGEWVIKSANKPMGESLNLAEVFSKKADYTRTFDESWEAAHLATKRVDKGFAEALASGDSLVKEADKLLAESCKVTPTFDRKAGVIRGFSENVSALDNIQKGFHITADESLSTGERVIKSVDKAMGESLNLAERFDKGANYIRTVDESILITAIKAQAFHKALGETCQWGESITKRNGKNLGESWQLAETRYISFNKALDELPYVNDSFKSKGLYSRSFPENLIPRDYLSKSPGKHLSELLVPQEGISAMSLKKSIPEELGMADSFSRIAYYICSFPESALNIKDKPLDERPFGLVDIILLFEGLKARDIFGREVKYYRSLGEVLASIDSPSKWLKRGLSEGIRVPDDSIAKKPGKGLSEPVNVRDAFGRIANYLRSFSEGMSWVDSLSKGFYKSLRAETFVVGDSLDRQVQYQRSPSEPLWLIDSPYRKASYYRSLSCSLGLIGPFHSKAGYYHSFDEAWESTSQRTETYTEGPRQWIFAIIMGLAILVAIVLRVNRRLLRR